MNNELRCNYNTKKQTIHRVFFLRFDTKRQSQDKEYAKKPKTKSK